MTNTPVWGEDPVSAVILEKTGVTLDIEYTVEDFNTKAGLILSAGDYPDLLLSVNNDTVAQYADAGALVAFAAAPVDVAPDESAARRAPCGPASSRCAAHD